MSFLGLIFLDDCDDVKHTSLLKIASDGFRTTNSLKHFQISFSLFIKILQQWRRIKGKGQWMHWREGLLLQKLSWFNNSKRNTK
jgi:hypothetical protein